MSDHIVMYRCHLGSFVNFAFRELHPGEMLWDNWHIRLMANFLQFSWTTEHTEALRRLVFNLPPGSLKTHICSVSFPAWILGRDPRKSVLIVSETPDQALEIRERCVELMNTRRYRRIFPRARIVRSGKEIELSYGGRIRHAGVGYSLSSKKSDLVVIDNPQSLHNLDRIDPAPFVEIGRTLRDPKRGVLLLVTRRLGENDLSNFLYRTGTWAVFAMPVVAMKETPWLFPPDDDHVQRKGEPLNVMLDGWDEIEAHLREIGVDAFIWQYMQGAYQPVTSGHRPNFVDGEPAGFMIGNFGADFVVHEDFAALRKEYESGFRPLEGLETPPPPPRSR